MCERIGVSWEEDRRGCRRGDVWQAVAQRHMHMVVQHGSFSFYSMQSWSNIAACLQAQAGRGAEQTRPRQWHGRRLLPDDAHHAVHV